MSDSEAVARDGRTRTRTLRTASALRLFVGGLNKSTSEEVLFQYFSQFGDVSHVEIPRSRDAMSKGFGFVTFTNPSAPTEILVTNTHQLQGQSLRVELALALTERLAIHESYLARRLYLSGIPSTVTQRDIFEALSRFGIPESVTSLRRSNPYSNPNSFYCYVTMDRPQAVQQILQKKLLRCRAGYYIQVKPYLTASSKQKEPMQNSVENEWREMEQLYCHSHDYSLQKPVSTLRIPRISLTKHANQSTEIILTSIEPSGSSDPTSSRGKPIPQRQRPNFISWRNQTLIWLLPSKPGSSRSIDQSETFIQSEILERNSLQDAHTNLRFNVASRHRRGLAEQIVYHQRNFI